jgi:transcriptional regulator with XRE-family HTH domain
MDTQRIENIRKLKKLTQAEFAESIDMSTFGYQKMIKSSDPKASTLEKIARIYAVDISALFSKSSTISLSGDYAGNNGKPLKNTPADQENCSGLRQTITILNEQLKNSQATISALNNTVTILNTRLEDVARPAKTKRASTTP